MMKALVLVGVALLCACGSDDGETKDPGRDWTPPLEPPMEKPVECDRRRAGTYLVSFTTIDGSCGDQDSYIGRLDNDQPLPDGCKLTAADVWSDNDCKLERSIVCETDAFSVSGTIETRAVTTQQSADQITGLTTMLVFAGDGRLLCSGTYRLTAERQ